MEKIRCARCGAVNLEGFLTFPHCAGCGVQLPESGRPRAWKRPLSPLLWATLLGFGALGLAASTAWVEGRQHEAGHLLLYARAPRRVFVGETFTLRFVVDENQGRKAQFESVSLRLPHALLQKFQVIGVIPAPDETGDVGKGHQFYFRSLPRLEPLKLKMRARQPGRFRLSSIVTARDFDPANFYATIFVEPHQPH